MKPVQLKMARAAVGWGVRELAKKAGVTANTVTRIENGADAKQSTMDRLQQALEGAGVEFIFSEPQTLRLIPTGLQTSGWRKLQIVRVEASLARGSAEGDVLSLGYAVNPSAPR